jgi:hypothetical protein
MEIDVERAPAGRWGARGCVRSTRERTTMIRKTIFIALVVALGAAAAPAAPLALASPTQIQKEPAKDLFLHFLRVPGIEVRFVDYHWQPALFDAMERGDATVPEARRNWVIARVTLDERPLGSGAS